MQPGLDFTEDFGVVVKQRNAVSYFDRHVSFQEVGDSRSAGCETMLIVTILNTHTHTHTTAGQLHGHYVC